MLKLQNLYVCLFVAVWLSFLCAANLHGQTLVSPALESEIDESKSEPPSEVVFKFRAAAEPDPPLEYRFWPAAEHRLQTNPMPFVNRAVLLATQVNYDRDAAIEFNEELTQWFDLPLSELPLERVRAFIDRYGPQPLYELSRAENLMGLSYDLRFDELTAAEMISTLLPELKELRTLGWLLAIRARLAVAEERWDDFVRDIRIGMRLSEIAGHSNEFLINRLVGYAIAEIMFGVIEEAMQRPGCPNLYWALTTIPADDLFETRDALEFESIVTTRIFSGINPLPKPIIGAEAARERILRLVREAIATQDANEGQITSAPEVMGESESEATIKARLFAGVYVATMADSSRQLLADTDQWSDRVSQLSAPEAVLRATALRFNRLRDDWVKWAILPNDVSAPYQDRIKASLNRSTAKDDMLLSIVGNLVPAIDAAQQAGIRRHQEYNFLCTIEAIRMHVAVNRELPQSIDRLDPVPARRDTIARTDFGYHRRSADRATMTRAPRYPTDTETTIQLRLVK